MRLMSGCMITVIQSLSIECFALSQTLSETISSERKPQRIQCLPITSSKFIRKRWLWPLVPRSFAPVEAGDTPSLTIFAGHLRALSSISPKPARLGSGPDKVRTLDYALGSTLECAACHHQRFPKPREVVN